MPSTAASFRLSSAVTCTPPMKPSPIQGIRSAMSAGAWTQASSASKASASTLADSEATVGGRPASGAMILAQLMIDLPVQHFQTARAFPQAFPQAKAGPSLIFVNRWASPDWVRPAPSP
jgi:hypothetical protein